MDAATSHMGGKAPSKINEDVNKSIFDLFNNIRATDESQRNESCIALIQHLSGTSEPEAAESPSKNLNYCLERLIRGLGATRQQMQKGHFAALVCVLHSLPSISYEMFVNLVNKELGLSKNSSKREEGEAMMGQVLAYGAASRGGLFARSSSDQKKSIVTALLNCGKKKSYLPFASSSFIRDLILNSEESDVRDIIWPSIKHEVAKPWEDQTLDTLLFLITVSCRFPSIVKSKTIQKWLGFPLFSPQSMQHFAQRLVGSCNVLSLKHPIYDEFCTNLCLPVHKSLLETFWTESVHGFLTNPSKDLVVLQLLSIFLGHISDKQQIELLVTPRILEVIGRSLQGHPNKPRKFAEAHPKAREVMSSLSEALTGDDVSDKVRLSVLKKILFDSGYLQYEKQTGTRLAILLENKLNKKGVHKLVKQFRDVVDGNVQADGKVWLNSDRKHAAQQLPRLIGHQACSDDIEWKVEQLLFLLHRGVFRPESSSSVGVELAGTVRQCFFRALDQKFSNLETMISVLSQVVKHVNDILLNPKASAKVFRKPFSKEAANTWQKMMKTVSHLKEHSVTNGNKDSADKIFHILFLFMGLQLISDPDMAFGALQELHSCFERVKDGKRDSKRPEEPQWVEVTIDLFLSLLSHDSHLLRTVVNTVFPQLSKHLTVSAFYQILEVLDPAQNENPLTSSENTNQDSDSDSEKSSDSEESSKVGLSKTTLGKSNGNGTQEDSPDSSNTGGESDEEDEGTEIDDNDEEDEDDEDELEDATDEDMDEDETINDKLRQEVRLALGNAASFTDTESVDLDDIDEVEGQRMDEALAQAFKTLKQSRNTKKSKKQLKSEEAVTHFRNRVLDLVELYVSREPSLDLCLESITPLLSLLAFCMKDVHQKPLESKTRSVLRKLTSLKKFSSLEGVSEESLAEQIKSLAGKGMKSANTFLGLSDIISESCTFIVRCSELVRSHSSKPAKHSLVACVYEAMLVDFFTKRDTLLPVSMFKSALNLQWSGCWKLAPLLVQQAFDCNLRPFRRGQAVDLLSIFFRNNHLLKSADGKQKQCLKDIVSSIISHSIELLNSFISKSSKPLTQNYRHLSTVLRLVHQILSRPETKPPDSASLSSALSSFCQSSSGVSSDLKKVLKILSKLLHFNTGALKTKNLKKLENVQLVNGSKEDSPNKVRTIMNEEKDVRGNGEGQVIDPKKTKVALKGKNKKVKKLQRMALMGQGLDLGTFSSVNEHVLNGVEPDDVNAHGFPHAMDSALNGHTKSTEPLKAKRKHKASKLDDPQISRKKKKTN